MASNSFSGAKCSSQASRANRPRSTAAEFQRTLLRELDFGREERNLQQFASHFRSDATVHFP